MKNEVRDVRFLMKYISEAAEKEISAIDLAKSEIEIIDQKLLEADDLRIKKNKLIEVLEYFNDDSYRATKDKSVDINDLKKKIIDVLSKEAKALCMREVIIKVGSYDIDSFIIRAVKELQDDDFVIRNDNGYICLP